MIAAAAANAVLLLLLLKQRPTRTSVNNNQRRMPCHSSRRCHKGLYRSCGLLVVMVVGHTHHHQQQRTIQLHASSWCGTPSRSAVSLVVFHVESSSCTTSIAATTRVRRWYYPTIYVRTAEIGMVLLSPSPFCRFAPMATGVSPPSNLLD